MIGDRTDPDKRMVRLRTVYPERGQTGELEIVEFSLPGDAQRKPLRFLWGPMASLTSFQARLASSVAVMSGLKPQLR